MLALATHEPHFRVLREDVFAQDAKNKGCRICGQEGHIAVNCTGEKKEKSGEFDQKAQKKPERKPFIFLDVSILREYLEVELDVPGLPFGFDLERALDDWVFLIFFVGNDFLPHLPSLEIREGAIDTLLKIWKAELPRMGGYLTNHGKVELERAQLILEGLARSEDDIFRRRKEAEERQDASAKRRKIEAENRKRDNEEGLEFGGSTYVPVKPSGNPSAQASSVPQDPRRSQGIQALGGDSNDVVRNRAAIRMANLNAAEALKAEMSGGKPGKKEANVDGKDAQMKEVDQTTGPKAQNGDVEPPALDAEQQLSDEPPVREPDAREGAAGRADGTVGKADGSLADPEPQKSTDEPVFKMDEEMASGEPETALAAQKRKRTIEDVEGGVTAEGDEAAEVDDAADDDVGNESVDPVTSIKERKVNPDGTVEYEDTVKLWEPGYRERYYREKFGVELSDTEFRRNVVKSYVEGLCWVLAYYYQGVPSWQWYYPYHYSPFAADFTDLATLDIKFELGEPFRPFEQLMAVLPAAR